MLSLTGSFAFKTVMDVYTLNFFHDDQTGSIFYTFVDYFLALFPVFTLTSSYIIVAITLTNNVKVLLKMIAKTNYVNLKRRQMCDDQNSEISNDENEALVNNTSDEEFNNVINSSQVDLNNDTYTNAVQQYNLISSSNEEYNNENYIKNVKKNLQKLTLPALVIAFPTLLSFFTDNVLLLASITGSYPGVGVQFIIPSILALGARSYLKQHFNSLNIPRENASPFHQWFWPYITISWAIFAVIVVSSNLLHFK